MRNILTALATTIALAGAAAPASADPIVITGVDSNRVTAMVNVAGLDADQLDRRLAQAASRVCGAPDGRSLEDSDLLRACRSAAVADARQRLAGLPAATTVTLAAIY